MTLSLADFTEVKASSDAQHMAALVDFLMHKVSVLDKAGNALAHTLSPGMAVVRAWEDAHDETLDALETRAHARVRSAGERLRRLIEKIPPEALSSVEGLADAAALWDAAFDAGDRTARALWQQRRHRGNP